MTKFLPNYVSLYCGQLALRLESDQSDIGLRIVADRLYRAGFQLTSKVSAACGAEFQRQIEGEFCEGTSEGPHAGYC